MVDVIIIGGGASGLVCGIEAARRGKQCLILEQKEKAGKKLYASGNGKCNFANRMVEAEAYHSVAENGRMFLSQVITGDICQEAEEFFSELGIPAVERQGCLYPRSEQAAALVHALEQAFFQWKGRILCKERVERIRWEKEASCFRVQTQTQDYTSRKLVLAAGGMAAAQLGSDGSGYELAAMLGHHVTSFAPALCGLKCKERGWNRLQGVRAKGRVELWQDGVPMGQDTGEIQFTQYGVSGIVIFNLSRYASLGLMQNRRVHLVLDLIPEYTREELLELLQKLRMSCGFRSLSGLFAGFLPDKLADFLIAKAGLEGTDASSRLSQRELEALISCCKQLNIRITAANSFEQAQVTAGGVPLEEIQLDTMESKCCPNCYLTGELLDVDAICGGYNLMWAWRSGRRAGRSL
ncbi:MAG: aminoacetone oxidase family FAD-binding enzyme [Bacteroides sp.]|nr:aminoacetone oxidase family FAD-binding enzyme [Bacteroides sp.]MCM1549381.1 aminoacetone oxidase family FAD-binding enzyme [Clostridium sp.]